MKHTRQYIPLEGLSELEQSKRERRGRRYRAAADIATYGRTAFGAGLSLAILSGTSILPKKFQYRSVGMAASMVGLVAADKADGILARRAAKNGIPILDHDKKKDPFQDKVFAQMIMGAVAVRELCDGNVVFGSVVLGCQVTKFIRDYKMTQSRDNAHPDADVSAITINKYKTGLEGFSHTLATSPLTETSLGRFVVGSSYVASNVMGLVGYRIADERHKTPATSVQ